MAQTISNAGAPVVELGSWVTAQNNAEYTSLMAQHASELEAGTPVSSDAFNAMVNAFLAATNQSIAA